MNFFGNENPLRAGIRGVEVGSDKDRVVDQAWLFLRAPDAGGGEALQSACIDLAGTAPGVIAVNLMVPPPPGIPPRPGDKAEARPPYDVIVECSPEEAAALRGRLAASEGDTVAITGGRGRSHVEIDSLGPAPAEGRMKVIAALSFHADLPQSARERSWTHHAALAAKVHAAMTRYVRTWVTPMQGVEPPPLDGLAQLWFASPDDVVERYFDSPRGRDEIIHDTGHFIAGATRLYAREHRLDRP